MEVTYLKGLAKTEVIYVDNQTFGDFRVDGFHFQFLHRKSKLTTGFNTFGVAFNLDRNRHNHGLLVVHFEQVDVENIVFDRMELHLTEHCGLLLTLDIQLDGEDVGSVDEFANVVVGNDKVGGKDTAAVFDFYDFLAFFDCPVVGKLEGFATIEDYGDFTFSAEGLGCFFAKVRTGLGGQIVSFHCLFNCLCYSKLN